MVMCMVQVIGVAVVFTVNWEGEIVQVAPVGAPEQVNVAVPM